jgi:hypothetical protein
MGANPTLDPWMHSTLEVCQPVTLESRERYPVRPLCESTERDDIMPEKDDRTVVIINEDGSIYPFMTIFDLENDGEDELIDLITNYLESKGRKLGTFYHWI